MKKCFFWGATGQAKVLNEFINDFGYKLTCLFDNNDKLHGEKIDNVKILGGTDYFLNWSKQNQHDDFSFLVAIGGDKGKERIEIQEKISKLGFKPLTVWHKTSYIARSVRMGLGTQILMRASVGADTTIGKSCIINTAAQIDHECTLGDGVHIMPGAILTGRINVHKFATIGSGAIILPRLTIGEAARIGAGAVVTKDVLPYTAVAGNPARILK